MKEFKDSSSFICFIHEVSVRCFFFFLAQLFLVLLSSLVKCIKQLSSFAFLSMDVLTIGYKPPPPPSANIYKKSGSFYYSN